MKINFYLPLILFFSVLKLNAQSPQVEHIFNSSGIFVVPCGVTTMTVECWGAGGGGGGDNNTATATAGGGGGGAYTYNGAFAVTPGQVINFSVGVGGNGGAAGSSGSNGGITSFSTVTANGGVGGGGSTGANGTGGAGGTGGTIAGSAGATGAANASGAGGAAGNAAGTGGLSVTVDGNGNNGTSPGGGGSGANHISLTTNTGGNGANGRIIISYVQPVCTPCGGNFYDAGGSSNNYNNNETSTWIFNTSSSGYKLKFQTLIGDIGAGDTLRIYNGNSTAAPLIATYANTNFSLGNPTFQPSGIYLTFQLKTDGVTTAGGWDMAISCLTPSIASISATSMKKGRRYDTQISGVNTTFTANTPGKQFWLKTGADSIPGTILTTTNDSLINVRFTPACNMSTGSSYILYTQGYNMGQVSLPSAVNLLGMSANVTPTNPLCNGACNGSAVASPVNGNGTITYSWAPSGGTSSTAVSLCAGSYTVTLTDSASCTAIQPVTIGQPSALSISAGSSTSICVGASTVLNGSATGGTPGYTYSWSPVGTLSSSTIANPTASPTSTTIYTLTVTDANGCVSSSNVTITVNSLPTVLVNNLSYCVGANGILNASGATTYSWAPVTGLSAPTGANVTCNAGSSATYTVTGTNVNGCVNTAIATITVNPLPVVTANNLSICSGSSGLLIATGATTYSWAPPAGLSSTTGANVTCNASSTTTYTVTGTNANGCINTATSNVTVNPLPSGTISVNTDSICVGGNVLMTASAAGADTYSWPLLGSNSVSATAAPSVTTNYYVVLTNSVSGCKDTVYQQITVLPSISVNVVKTDVTCFGFANGTVTANVSGSNGSLSYSWSNGMTAQTLGGLRAGSYTVNVTDGFMCTGSASATVNEPSAISVSLSPTNVNCGQTTGSISSSVVNGTAPYTYLWSNGSTSSGASNLNPGVYRLEVLDANGCQGMATANVLALDGAIISLNSLTDVSCYGGNNGAIATTISGGTAPLSVLWSTGNTTNSISSLMAGVYDVSVTDATGCITNSSFVVNQPSPIVIVETINNASCNGSDGSASIVVSGGTSPYSYLWSANAGAATTVGVNSLAAGFYSVQVTDANSCVTTKNISIGNSTNDIGIVLNSIQPSSCGSPVGLIDLTVTGNAPPLVYQWSSGQVTEDMINAIPGNYGFMVSDANFCSVISAYEIPSKMAGFIPQICLVTVNDTTNMNRILWERQYGLGIKQYNVYRETSVQGSYIRVATVPITNPGFYQDTVANTNSHSWRYKISAVDSCDVESEWSHYQKTIHRVITPNISTGNVDLNWDYYDGATFDKYYIYRELGVGWELIDSVSNTTLNYTDIAPPSTTLDYRIDANVVLTCDPALRIVNNGDNIMTTIVKSKSNIKNTRTVGIKSDILNLNSKIKVYPNPANDVVNVVVEDIKTEAAIIIENMLGQVVYTIQTDKSNNLISTRNLTTGVYSVKVKTGKGIVVEKIIIE